MDIQIIGTESLGVRGLCCQIITSERRIVIDPGVALGYIRHKKLPHPIQIGVGAHIRFLILDALAKATDIVFSHYHGDHVPLREANPYQLSLEKIHFRPQVQVWGAPSPHDGGRMDQRRADLQEFFGSSFQDGIGANDGVLSFPQMVFHGEKDGPGGRVMLTQIRENGTGFLHASDLQFLDKDSVDAALQMKPDILLGSGPPLYLMGKQVGQKFFALENLEKAAALIQTLILDHHLLRSREGLEWIRYLDEKNKGRVLCAADYMGIPLHLLEADRRFLYELFPVPKNWHQEYIAGKVGTDVWLKQARSKLPWFSF